MKEALLRMSGVVYSSRWKTEKPDCIASATIGEPSGEKQSSFDIAAKPCLERLRIDCASSLRSEISLKVISAKERVRVLNYSLSVRGCRD
jgi:hypothetical protein